MDKRAYWLPYPPLQRAQCPCGCWGSLRHAEKRWEKLWCRTEQWQSSCFYHQQIQLQTQTSLNNTKPFTEQHETFHQFLHFYIFVQICPKKKKKKKMLLHMCGKKCASFWQCRFLFLPPHEVPDLIFFVDLFAAWNPVTFCMYSKWETLNGITCKKEILCTLNSFWSGPNVHLGALSVKVYLWTHLPRFKTSIWKVEWKEYSSNCTNFD